MPPTASLADYHYRAVFSPTGRHVRFMGPGGFYDAMLLRGGLGGQVGLAFSLIGRPSGMLGRLRRSKWTVAVPRRSKYPPGIPTTKDAAGLFSNTREARRILIIEGPEVVVLRFTRQIPRSLVYCLKTAFTGAEYPPWFARDEVPGVQSPEDDDETAEQEESDGTRQEGGEQGQPAPAVGVQLEKGTRRQRG